MKDAVRKNILVIFIILLIMGVVMTFRFIRMNAHGTLMEVRWESDGNKQGSSYATILKAEESGELRLTTRASDRYDQPYTVNIYRADDNALEQLRAIIDQYGIAAWSELAVDRENIQLDGLSTSITMIFNDESIGGRKREFVTVSYEAKLPDGALDALGEFTDCLNQWATVDRLLDTFEAAKR